MGEAAKGLRGNEDFVCSESLATEEKVGDELFVRL